MKCIVNILLAGLVNILLGYFEQQIFEIEKNSPLWANEKIGREMQPKVPQIGVK